MARPVDAVIAAAREFLGERITTNAALREQHSHGEDAQPRALPDAVAFLEASEEAARLLALCHAHAVPVVIVMQTAGTVASAMLKSRMCVS